MQRESIPVSVQNLSACAAGISLSGSLSCASIWVKVPKARLERQHPTFTPMFEIHDKGSSTGKARLVADTVLTPTDFRSIADQLGAQVIRARKIGYVAALKATSPQVVETRWNGKETSNTARPGDWIVTSLSPQREALRDDDGNVNRYVIMAERFASLYEPADGAGTFGAIHRAKGMVEAISLPGGFDIVAPWGERQTAPAGYLLCNGPDVYGNNQETFAATYEVVSG